MPRAKAFKKLSKSLRREASSYRDTLRNTTSTDGLYMFLSSRPEGFDGDGGSSSTGNTTQRLWTKEEVGVLILPFPSLSPILMRLFLRTSI